MTQRILTKPWSTEQERWDRAEQAAQHLPQIPENTCVYWSDEDVDAMRAAFRKRSNEDLPRTETLFAVAAIGYRCALRDMMAGADAKPKS